MVMPPSPLIPYISSYGPRYVGITAVWSSSVQAQWMSLLLPRTHSLHPLDLVVPTTLAQTLAARRSPAGRRGRRNGARRWAFKPVQRGRLPSHKLPCCQSSSPLLVAPYPYQKAAATCKYRHFQATARATTAPCGSLVLLEPGHRASGDERSDRTG